MHGHPVEQAITGDAFATDRKTSPEEGTVAEHGGIALPGAFALGPRGNVRRFQRQRRKSPVLGPVPGKQHKRRAAHQDQEDRQPEDPAPVESLRHQDAKRESQRTRSARRQQIESDRLPTLMPGPPVSQRAAQCGPSGRLRTPIGAPAHQRQREGRAETDRPIKADRQRRTDRHQPAGAIQVAEVPSDRLPQAITNEQRAAEHANGSRGQSQARLHPLGREPEILPSQVKEKVTEHHQEECPPLRGAERAGLPCR